MSSKSSDGPSASSFISPRKTGWLYKHGGSGVSSHWRKRWFIVDHHYLFYYKGPNDKKPVGILCLPDYDSCHKADGKEWKKPYTFILDKGNAPPDPDIIDAPTKNYVLYSDTEEEMLEWINAITGEIKPAMGSGRGMANGHPTMTPRGGKKEEVDQKAFDELTKSVHEGPKLTHLTAQRPKVRGRRPPQRYATYHEDDSKEDTPPSSPPEHRKALPKIPSPARSPATVKKGHHPTVPLKPKARTESSVKLLDNHEAVETVTKTEDRASPSVTKTRPLPPKKPPKEPTETTHRVSPSPPHEGDKSPEPNESTSSPKRSQAPKPTPPKKPSKDDRPTTEVEQKLLTKSDNASATDSRPVPLRKPKPQPPIKPRTPSTVIETSPGTLAPAEQPTPTKRPTPVPRKRPRAVTDNKEETPKEQVVNEVEVEKEPVRANVEEPVRANVEEHLPVVEELSESVEEVQTKDEKEEAKPAPLISPTATPQTKEEEGEDDLIGSGYVNVEICEPLENEDKIPEKEASAGESPKPREKTTQGVETAPPIETNIVNVPLGSEAELPSEDVGDTVNMEEEAGTTDDGRAQHELEVASCEEDLFSPGYEKMHPTEPIRITPDGEDYEPVNEGVIVVGGVVGAVVDHSHEYEEPAEWQPSSGEEDVPPLPPQYNEDAFEAPTNFPYDIPPPPRPATNVNHPYDVPTSSELSFTRGRGEGQRNGLRGSSGSTSLDQKRELEATHDRTTVGKAGETVKGGRQLDRDKTLANGNPQKPKQRPENDAFGYARVNKAKYKDSTTSVISNVSQSSASTDENSEWLMVELEGEQVGHTIPATLKQAREILRLARVVKAETEQMRQEAQRELELAKVERRDAELLKRNAAEILKMAKERLHLASK